jgi:hypothetical protein
MGTWCTSSKLYEQLLGVSCLNLTSREGSKVKSNDQNIAMADVQNHSLLSERRHYSTVHCTGYIKSWEPSKMSASSVEEDPGAEEAGDSCNLNCLVAMGLLMPTDPDITASSAAPAENALNVRPLDFTSRHMVDGKFMQVDPR